MMINQRNNICRACKDVIVVEDLNCSNSFEANAVSFWWNDDFDNFLFARFMSLSFEIDRFSRYWLKISNVILFFFFFLTLFFWYFRLFFINATTLRRFSISLTWQQFKTKSITKNSKSKCFFFFFFSSISIVLTQDLSNDEKFELFVSQKSETSFFMTSFSSRNIIFFLWTISLLFELRTADDHSTDSKIEKTKTNKLSMNELTKKQTKKQKMKTIFFSTFDSSFSSQEASTDDDRFSSAKSDKTEETANETIESSTESRERIKIESQNSQSKWTFSSIENSAKRQTTHANSSFKFFSQTNFKSSFHSSSSKDDNESKNWTEQTDRQSKFSRWST